jgi:hypothetical protein
LQADAAGINGATDAGLTPLPPLSVVDAIPDDRLFTVAEISALLKIRRSDVYGACDRGHLRYVKFEGAVQVEGRDLKAYLNLGARRRPVAGSIPGPILLGSAYHGAVRATGGESARLRALLR